jgi:mono/diheme cytochrome c family protein
MPGDRPTGEDAMTAPTRIWKLSFVAFPALLLYAGAQGSPRPSQKAASPADVAYAQQIAPLIKQYCVGCHQGSSPSGGINLTGYASAAAVLKGRDTWTQVSRNLATGHMPPEGAPHPTQAQRDRIVAWIDGTITKADCQLHDPGRVTMRRLNREEYNNTIRDLLGVNLRPADEFPSDDSGYGFDNIGDVLSISPLLMEKFVNAAEKVAAAAIITPEAATKPTRFQCATLPGANSTRLSGIEGHLFTTNTSLGTPITAPTDGEYVLRARGFGQQAGPDPAKMAFLLDGKTIQTVDVEAVEKKPEIYEIRTHIPAGQHKFEVAFTNDYYVPAKETTGPDGKKKYKRAEDRNLFVEYLEVQPDAGVAPPLPASHKRIFIAMPQDPNDPAERMACARKIMAAFARRAWRRPVTADEVNRLARYVDLAAKNGESFERGIQLAVTATLCSPNFLFHVETDPQQLGASQKRLLNDYELASRLSYFLWSSMPDDELFTLASKGKLQDPTVLAAQARRMLRNPKAQALADNFSGQWLQLRNLAGVAPDTQRFPDFNDKLRTAMRTETEMFFQDIMSNDRSILDFLNGKFTYLNGDLAKHYDIPGVEGDQFRRVALTGDRRGGVLTQASILTITSNPTRTSPVKRGKWVLEQILGTPPPPAPPNVPKLADDNKGQLVGTLRQRMEQHRKNPICASCHAQMDPIGFGLENFDAVGKWRDKDGDSPVDASGVLPGKITFAGPAQLETILMSKKKLFVRNFVGKMLTYALGRGVTSHDSCNIDAMASTVAANNYKFSSVITAVTQSDPFRMRRGDGGEKN